MSPRDFLNSVIRPTLTVLDLGGSAAENLLLGTAIQESRIRDIQQVHGRALGYFQMEPPTHDDIWKNYLSRRFALAVKVRGLLPSGTIPSPQVLLAHPQYECAMARVHYLRAPGGIPSDLAGQARYYKTFYNTPLGAATEREYIDNYMAAVGVHPCA